MNRNIPKRLALLSILIAGIVLAIVTVSLSARQQSPQQPPSAPQQQRPPMAPLPPGWVRQAPPATGAAPKMKSELLSTGPVRTFRLTFGQGDEILSGLTDFASTSNIDSGYFTGIGGLLTATLGWGDPTNGAFKVINVDQKCELVSLIGNIVRRNGKPYVHAHTVVSLSDGTTRGGHLLDARVSPFAEIYLVEAKLPSSAKPAE